jgi:hypothetical protein
VQAARSASASPARTSGSMARTPNRWPASNCGSGREGSTSRGKQSPRSSPVRSPLRRTTEVRSSVAPTPAAARECRSGSRFTRSTLLPGHSNQPPASRGKRASAARARRLAEAGAAACLSPRNSRLSAR